MFWSFLLAGIVIVMLAPVKGDRLSIQLLPDVNMEPIKVVYKSYFPLTFMVTVMNTNNGTDKCKGVVGDQFGVIGVYGATKGLNIVPSWEEATAETFAIDIYFLNNDNKINNISFTGLQFQLDEDQRGVFAITIDYNVVTVYSKSLIPASKPMDPSYLPDFIDGKFLSLSFFQPFQQTPAITDDEIHRDVNKCRFVLDYNGKYIWRPGQPFVIGQN